MDHDVTKDESSKIDLTNNATSTKVESVVSNETTAAEGVATNKVDKRLIMIVDDDKVMLRAMVNILKDTYRTTVATSAMQALQMLATVKPNLILLDLQMPVCDGVQMFNMLRSNEDTKEIPVIFLTGSADAETVRRVMRLNPAGYILKSTKPNIILEKLHDYFLAW